MIEEGKPGCDCSDEDGRAGTYKGLSLRAVKSGSSVLNCVKSSDPPGAGDWSEATSSLPLSPRRPAVADDKA